MVNGHHIHLTTVWTIVSVTVWILSPSSQGEVFSSLDDLELLVNQERGVLEAITGSLEINDTDKVILDGVLQAFGESQGALDVSSDCIIHPAQHPIDAFMTIKYWLALHELYEKDESVALREKLANVTLWATQSDYDGAISGIIRLQRTYLLSTEQLVSGTIAGYTSMMRLQPEDMLNIGRAAMKTDYACAAEWFEQIIELVREDEASVPVKIQAESCLSLSIIHSEAGNTRTGLRMASMALTVDPRNVLAKGMFERLSASIGDSSPGSDSDRKETGWLWRKVVDPVTVQYESLCRGDDLYNDIRVNSELVCVYKTSRLVPYLVYREEIHHIDPRISLFIDVISEREAQQVIELAHPKMERAGVGNPKNSSVHQGRVSKTSWLFDEDSPMVTRLSRRIEDITGLQTQISVQMSSSEAFQVVSYGVGGQYETHVDYFTDDLLKHLPPYIYGTGRRLSTFLFYLSDAKAGGATVFPSLDVRVPPVQYGAAFWYNLKRSGNVDPLTAHAGCPILIGKKWVTNKWIREYGQESRRPCGLKPTDIDPIL